MRLTEHRRWSVLQFANYTEAIDFASKHAAKVPEAIARDIHHVQSTQTRSFPPAAELARKGLDLGFYVSLSGIVTFKNAQDLQDIAKWLPADQMLVETDSPFLAPVPHRGQKCEPAFVADTARFVADLRGEEPEALAEATTANFFRLFKKARAA